MVHFQLVLHAPRDGGTRAPVTTRQEVLPAWPCQGRGPTSSANASHTNATAHAAVCQIGSNWSRSGPFASTPALLLPPQHSPGASGQRSQRLKEAQTTSQRSATWLSCFRCSGRRRFHKRRGTMCIPSPDPSGMRTWATANGQQRCCQAAPGPCHTLQVVHVVISVS